MARRIYDYTKFTHQKEQLQAIRKKRAKDRRKKWLFLLLAVLCMILAVRTIQQSRCKYYRYKEEIKTEKNSGVFYESFANGYVKYSSNGIEYQKEFGTSEWNIALNYSKPFVAISKKYLLLGDRGGNQAILFDENGTVNNFTLKNPLVQLGVSDNGNIEVIMEGDQCNYIEVYSAKGDVIAEMKVTLNETGYPVTAALSPDGSQLVISFFVVKDMKGITRMAFYDLSQQIQQESIPLKAGYEYDNLIPKIAFIDKNKVVAIGDNASYFYDITDEVKLIRKLEFGEKIESIFVDGSNVGYIFNNDNPDKEGRYHICLYNVHARQKVNSIIDMNYDKVSIVGKDIVATKDNECTILNSKGQIMFQGALEGSYIENVLPCRGWRTYRVVFENKIVKMQLSFSE